MSHTVKIKLAKRPLPCLSFEIRPNNVSSKLRNIVHDISVEIWSTKLAERYELPEIEGHSIIAVCDDLRLIKSIVDGMKNLGDSISIGVKADGTVTFQAINDFLTVKSIMTSVPVSCTDSDSSIFEYQAEVDLKKFCSFVSSCYQIIPTSRLTCKIYHNKALVHYHAPVSLFMPARVLEL